MSGLLAIGRLNLSYGNVEALRASNPNLAENRIVTPIGPSGAVTTTSLNAVVGLVPCTGGIRHDG